MGIEISNISLIIGVSLFALVYMIYNNISEQLSVGSYISTTYMYIFFAFLFIILVNEQKLVPDLRYNIKFFALCILMIILTITLSVVSTEKQIIKHLVWLALIYVMAVVLNPVYELAKNENILNKVIITISAMFIVMSYFAYTKPVSYFDSWYPYLYSGLIAIIVSRLLNIIFSDLDKPSGFFSRDFGISIITILLFNGFLLYDTQKIIKEGLVLDYVCRARDNLSCADYTSKSMAIILDMLNLFVNVTNIYKKK
jgi:FtsH-binding integral membrane protein